MLKIIDFIKNNPDWREILKTGPYNLSINDDGGFTILKYSQINSDFNNEIVRECRGLIIDKNLNPVCVPFFKFGNYGEPYAAEIDWESAKVEEKIDGSLIKVWNYKGKWTVSTNGTIFADKATIGSESDSEIKTESKFKSFGDLFKAAIKNTGLEIESLDPDYTYMFELVSPYNRVVVPYESIDLYHIGARNNVSLTEAEVDTGVKKPKTYKCNNLSDLIEMASKLRYCEEGYVVKDKNYNRIKVKSPAYVAVQHLISGMSDKRMLELLKTNEIGEFLVYFPEYKKYADDLLAKTEKVAAYINNILRGEIDGKIFETRKDYAAAVTKTKYPAFFFLYYDGKFKNPSDWLWSLPGDKILEQIEKSEKL